MSKPTITGLVLTLNGERYLKECLNSLDFCTELLVVDSQSTDKTARIAQDCGARFLVNPWNGPKAQFDFAFAQITTPWVISLDQDEIVSKELRADIVTALEEAENFGAFLCPRTSFYFDHFLRHSGWYPDLLPRVFRLETTTVHVSGPHYGFTVSGSTKRLHGDIIHYPYENLRQHVEKMNYYTQVAAEELVEKGKYPCLTSSVGHGIARFCKVYFFRGGILDGKAGFILAVNSFFYAFHKYIRAMELWKKREKSTQDTGLK